MFFLATVARPEPDARMWTVAHPLPGCRAVTAGMATAGLLTSWFCDVMAPETGRAGRDGTYRDLIAAASAIPQGADGLLCLPYFAGERTPVQDPDARGIFAGLTLRHTRAHLFRATLEGMAFAARHNLEVMREMQAPPSRLVAVGGGTRNPLWLQVTSDITGVPQVIPERTIGASLGDAFLAGLASGIIPDLTALDRDWARIAGQVDPNPAHRERYDAMHALYLDVYERTKDTIHRLGAIARES
jgi:xylulokinase